MTGHGEARAQQDEVSVAVEVRTINSRHFKLNVRADECSVSLEPRIEAVVRKQVRRGTVLVTVNVDREVSPDHYTLNGAVLRSYRNQLEEILGGRDTAESIRLDALLELPGVVNEHRLEDECAVADWPLIEKVLVRALENLHQMRRDEGRAMADDLESNCRAILKQVGRISERAPRVAEAYRARLTERLNKMLVEYDTEVEPAAVVREVGLMAERSDISEELVRLRSHVDQFRTMTKTAESSGRKLDFLTQEMFREANTIGSKANDAAIAAHVVEAKALIERMREMIQNIE